jgi:hypothetical protein
LFGGQGALAEALVNAVAAAPDSASPIDAVGAGLIAIGPMFEERRSRSRARQRQAIIAANASLHERELMKLSTLATALTEALRARGVAETTARLTAESAVAVFKYAFERWIGSGDDVRLADVIRELLDALPTVTARPSR